MKNIIIDGVEYTPVVKETVEDNRQPGRYWYPQSDDDDHYYIGTLGDVSSSNLSVIKSANYGNAFQTKQEAEKELAKRKVIVIIKSYISDRFGVFEPNWSDENTRKYSFYYDNIDAKMYHTCNFTHISFSPIGYLSCEEHAQEIIKKFDAELRLIFGV